MPWALFVAEPNYIGFGILLDPQRFRLSMWLNPGVLSLTPCHTHDVLGSACG